MIDWLSRDIVTFSDDVAYANKILRGNNDGWCGGVGASAVGGGWLDGWPV